MTGVTICVVGTPDRIIVAEIGSIVPPPYGDTGFSEASNNSATNFRCCCGERLEPRDQADRQP